MHFCICASFVASRLDRCCLSIYFCCYFSLFGTCVCVQKTIIHHITIVQFHLKSMAAALPSTLCTMLFGTHIVSVSNKIWSYTASRQNTKQNKWNEIERKNLKKKNKIILKTNISVRAKLRMLPNDSLPLQWWPSCQCVLTTRCT